MKPLFGIDITDNKKNTVFNGRELIIAAASSELMSDFQKSSQEVETVTEKAKLPLPLRIIKTVCGGAGLLLGVALLRALLDVGIAHAYQNAPAIFYVCGAALIIWGVLTFLSIRKNKSVMESEGAQQTVSGITQVSESLYRDLGVPEDALSVDILVSRYKIKNGEAVPRSIGLNDFFNLDAKVYTRDGQLCISDLEHTYALPLDGMKQIRCVKKNVSISSWNKDIPYNEGIYKPYKMTVNNLGMLFIKPYYILECEANGEIWGVYFPAYELPAITSMTGLSTESSSALETD